VIPNPSNNAALPLQAFNPFEQEHVAARKQAKTVCLQLNALPVHHAKARSVLCQSLFGKVSSAFIEPGFFCDYGSNIYIGEQFYANHGCIMLDAAPIHIGDRVLLGPNVHLYTTTHPQDAAERASGKQCVAPITLEDDCWIGGNTVVMPGVTIGAGAVIGAGSVVTHSIAAGKVAFGNPCREIRNAAEAPVQVESVEVKKEPQKAQHKIQQQKQAQRQQAPATTTNIMAWSSGIAFLLATMYFLKMVYDSGWLTPLNQLALATLAGVMLIVTGILFSEKDKNYSAYLPAFGMSILYITAYVAYLYYHFLSFEMAIVVIALVSVTGIWLDRRFHHSVYIIFTTAGVYFSPLLLSSSWINGGWIIGNSLASSAGLDGYVIPAADLALYYTAWSLLFSFCAVQENRRLIYILALFFSMIGFDIVWRTGQQLDWMAAAAFQLLQFTLFTLTAAYLSVRHAKPMNASLAVTQGIALLYFYVMQYSLIHEHNPLLAPWLALASAVFLVFILLAAKQKMPADQQPEQSAVLVSAYCCMVTTHIVFFEWLPAEWLPWGALLLALAGVQILVRYAGRTAAVYPAIIMCSVLFVWGFIQLLLKQTSPVVPAANWALAAYASVLYASYFRLSQNFSGARYASGLLYAAHFALMVLTIRVLDKHLAVSLVWAVLAITLLFVAIKRKDRTLGSSSLLIFTASGLKVLLYDLSDASSGMRVLVLLVLGVSLYVGGWLYQQLGKAAVQYHPNPDVNRQLNAIREWLEQGLSPQQIIETMVEQRMRNLDGKPWTIDQLQKISRDYGLSVA